MLTIGMHSELHCRILYNLNKVQDLFEILRFTELGKRFATGEENLICFDCLWQYNDEV